MGRPIDGCRSLRASAVNGYLLDTSAALLALVAPERLSAAAREALERGPHVLSTLTYWEVVLKTMKGKLDPGDPRVWWADAVDQLAARPLPLQARHVAAIMELPALHADPFDRALIAQAIVEGLTLVTTDYDMSRYASDHLRVIV